MEQQDSNLKLFDWFIELTSHQNLDTFLAEALAQISAIFKAEASSLLFLSNPPMYIRQGQFDPETARQINLWEKSIEERATLTSREIFTPRLYPIGTHTLTHNELKLLNIPLLSDVRIIGSLSLVLRPERMLDERQNQILTRFARAFGNVAQLMAELFLTQQKLRRLGLIYQMGQMMSSTFNLKKLLHDAMQMAKSITGAETASLFLLPKENAENAFKFALDGPETDLSPRKVNLSGSISGWVAANNEALVVNDVKADRRFNQAVDSLPGILTRSLLCVPLQTKGRTIGVLLALNKNAATGFDEEDLNLLLTLAAQAGIAIENARLYQDLREEKDKIIKAQESVRRELARRLHDGAIQLLAAIDMNLEYIKRLLKLKPEDVPQELENARQMTQRATKEARLVLFELRPLVLEDEGLVPALRTYVEKLRSVEPFTVHFEADELKQILDPKVAGTIFAITQEAVNNVKKHTQARNVWLSLRVEGCDLVLTIKDDGPGFDVSAVEQGYGKRGSLGLLNMRERAALIDGKLTIESGDELQEGGTLVTLRVPLSDAYPG
ncbi:MAG: GAF domain-containing sensor histidine kinase [Anaerolineae bacterium]